MLLPHCAVSRFFKRLTAHSSGMKFAFKIKTKPVTQATIIIAVNTVSSGSLALIAIYSQSLLVYLSCTVVLAIIVYVALHMAPR